MNIILAGISLFLALVALGIATLLWRRVATLQRQIDGMYEEISSLALAGKRLQSRIAALENRPAPPAATVHSPASDSPQKPPEKLTIPTPTAEKKQNDGENLWQDVVFLAKQGLSADTIAKDLNITRGEVELILGLHNFKPKQQGE